MNGPEHYAEAERLLTLAQERRNTAPIDAPGLPPSRANEDAAAQYTAQAQVHATLAQAAALPVHRIQELLDQIERRGGVRFTIDGEWYEVRADIIPVTRDPNIPDVMTLTLESVRDLLRADA